MLFVFKDVRERIEPQGALMGHLKKNEGINSANKNQSLASISAQALLYITSLVIITTLFALSFSWLLNRIDQFRFIGEVYQMSAGQIPISHETSSPSHPAFSLLTLPSVLTWFLGILAAKIGEGFVNFCWNIIKKLAKSIWQKTRKRKNDR
jgi:hypothetical protein